MQTPAFASTKTLPTVKLLRALIWIAAVMAACLCPTLAFGQTNSKWNGGTGNWSDLGDWNPAAVPNNSGTTTYDVKIGAANSNVTMDVLNDTIDNLTLTSKNSLTIDAGDSLSLVSGTSFNSGTINVTGFLNNDLGSAFTNAGTITSTSGTGNLSNTGTFTNNGTISNVSISNYDFPTPAAVFTNNGTITTAANGDLYNIDFNVFTNNGKITIVSTSAVINGGTFQNLGTIYNNGLLNNSPGVTGDGFFVNAGTINNQADGSLENGIVNTFDNTGTINNAGELSNYFYFQNGGKINDNGTLDNEGSLNNDSPHSITPAPSTTVARLITVLRQELQVPLSIIPAPSTTAAQSTTPLLLSPIRALSGTTERFSTTRPARSATPVHSRMAG
jgi:hypothetical protein